MPMQRGREEREKKRSDKMKRNDIHYTRQ